MKYTEKDLFAFINRADTFEKLNIAEEWLFAHVKDQKFCDRIANELYIRFMELIEKLQA